MENSFKYVFAYWSPVKKKWEVCNTYFILSKGFGENEIYGQFLTSNWFSHHHRLNEKLVPFHCAILGQKNEIDFKKTRNLLNFNNNVVPSNHDIHYQYFNFAEYFYLDLETIQDIVSKLKNEDVTTFTMRGYNKSKHRLSLNIRKYTDQGNQKICYTLPQFSA